MINLIRQNWALLFKANWKIWIILGISLKLLILSAIWLLSLTDANALSFNALGYKVSWNEAPDVIDEVSNMESAIITDEFDEDIQLINSLKESQLFLKELDYQRIGIIDVSSGKAYTAIINNEGIIELIEEGLNKPEIIIKANLPKARELIAKNDYIGLKDYVQLPFKLKLKILLMRWF